MNLKSRQEPLIRGGNNYGMGVNYWYTQAWSYWRYNMSDWEMKDDYFWDGWGNSISVPTTLPPAQTH
jgi:hypothetical protein